MCIRDRMYSVKSLECWWRRRESNPRGLNRINNLFVFNTAQTAKTARQAYLCHSFDTAERSKRPEAHRIEQAAISTKPGPESKCSAASGRCYAPAKNSVSGPADRTQLNSAVGLEPVKHFFYRAVYFPGIDQFRPFESVSTPLG